MRILPSSSMARVLRMEDALAAMEEAFSFPESAYQCPGRSHLRSGSATLLLMPAHLGSHHSFGAKIVSIVPANSKAGLEPIQAWYLLISETDGRLLALMDATHLTAVRTAAVSALATRLLAREGPARLAVFGTGTQARVHLESMALVRVVTEARICGSTPAKSLAFVKEHSDAFPFPLRATDPASSLEDADIVCTCTSSDVPVLEGRLLKGGVHINAVGAYRPDTRELDDDAVKGARIVLETKEGVLGEAGDILLPIASGALHRDQIAGELAELVQGKIQGRRADSDRTLFKSVGFALEDLTAALRAYENALAMGEGTDLDL